MFYPSFFPKIKKACVYLKPISMMGGMYPLNLFDNDIFTVVTTPPPLLSSPSTSVLNKREGVCWHVFVYIPATLYLLPSFTPSLSLSPFSPSPGSLSLSFFSSYSPSSLSMFYSYPSSLYFSLSFYLSFSLSLPLFTLFPSLAPTYSLF